MPRSQAAVREIDRVAVVGGGVIGLWTAHQLHAAGVGVTVLERDRVGSGASRANAGEVLVADAVAEARG